MRWWTLGKVALLVRDERGHRQFARRALLWPRQDDQMAQSEPRRTEMLADLDQGLGPH